ncbi:50S ribosomal protein L24 [Candidatus Portiera aleyrodidarum]|uniref:Large ribosomal subunit protein uL24 n=1 Tax=Candidatus Portiera aleyrodidarum TV TaxID=1297582 RepID=A0A8D4BUK0_9GAMM|nr:50S ribosomal protein L24 [Candidatus Portiera aleyrodidarum]AGI27117.1 ribosomal protein L24 [Candidatus Portiera aleyrodidarum TV]CEI59086.1 50S ribosomal protein L24 [Candidatus Portiera aleyrodidarum]
MYKIKRNDEVIVITGKEKGKIGKVKRIRKNKVWVVGINIRKYHKKNKGKTKGGIIKKEASINYSNIAIFNSEKGKADKVIIKEKNGVKIRIYKKNKKPIK